MASRSTVNENPAIRRGFLFAHIGVLITVFLIASPANARVFIFDGEIETCDPFACGLAGIGVGDPITGFIEVDDAASGPNSTFTEADILFYSLSIGGLSSMGPGDVGTVTLTTGANGEIVSGTLFIETTVDTGIGLAVVDITLDAATQTFNATTDFFGIGEIASGTVVFMLVADSDVDGIFDDADNCTLIANPSQIDSNGDNIGNACDADLDNNCVINFADLGIMKSVFFTPNMDADLDGNGVVNFADLGIMKAAFFGPPGPSAAGCN